MSKIFFTTNVILTDFSSINIFLFVWLFFRDLFFLAYYHLFHQEAVMHALMLLTLVLKMILSHWWGLLIFCPVVFYFASCSIILTSMSLSFYSFIYFLILILILVLIPFLFSSYFDLFCAHIAWLHNHSISFSVRHYFVFRFIFLLQLQNVILIFIFSSNILHVQHQIKSFEFFVKSSSGPTTSFSFFAISQSPWL